MSIWLARDEDGGLYAYYGKPIKAGDEFHPCPDEYENDYCVMGLDKSDFPDVTFENSPVKLFTNMTVQRLMVRMGENLNTSYNRGAKDMVMTIRSNVRQLCNIRQVLRFLDKMEDEDSQAEMQLAMLKAIAKDYPYRTIENIIQNVESRLRVKDPGK